MLGKGSPTPAHACCAKEGLLPLLNSMATLYTSGMAAVHDKDAEAWHSCLMVRCGSACSQNTHNP